MASLLSNLFGKTSSVDTPVGATRTVNLSGNYFSFAMPEDFSKDMPAENLVEELDVTDPQNFDNPEYGNLIRRWWDIRKPGFLGKNLGTVMMDISVQRVPENKRKDIHDRPYNILDRLDFLLMLDDSLHQRYDDLVNQTKDLDDYFSYHIPSTAHLLGKKIGTGFRDNVFAEQKWLGYSASAPSNQLIAGLVTPLSSQLYLEVVFTFAPDKNIFPREFRHYAYQKTELVEKSLKIEYEKNNSIQGIMKHKDWLKTTNDQVLQRNQDLLLIPFFGPDIYERLARQDEEVAQAMKLLAQEDGKSG